MTAADQPKVKRDRDEVFVEYTKSICPVCKAVVDAHVNIRGRKVYLRKRCREHGVFEALVYGDAQMYLDSARFNKPGTIPLVFQTEVIDGCPSHGQDAVGVGRWSGQPEAATGTSLAAGLLRSRRDQRRR